MPRMRAESHPRVTGRRSGGSLACSWWGARQGSLGLALLLFTCGPACASRDQALALVNQARVAIEGGAHEQARGLLTRARQADPQAPEVYTNLGYLEELQGHVEAAVAAYLQALSLNPDLSYDSSRLRGLVYGKRFPRTLPLNHLSRLPVEMEAEEVLALGSPHSTEPLRETIAYTTGLLYPETMRAGGALLELPLPIAGTDSGHKLRCNRVCYGFVAPSGQETLALRVALYYPSPTLALEGRDYAPLARLLTRWLTRLYAQYDLHLALESPRGHTSAYLCEAGPTGAETYDQNLYFYNLPELRTPLEWLREAAHEMGHVLLPKVGRFTEPEPWGNGHLGERLGLQWLAQEAGLAAGAPWPASAAQEHLRTFWGGQAVPLAGYLAQRCRPLLDTWTQAGAASPLLTQGNEAALSHFLGFMLWVQAAHGDALLAVTLQASDGTNPSDYLLAYQEAVTSCLAGPEGALVLHAGALNLVASRLTQKPVEGAQRREQVLLSPGDSAVWPLYLPAGEWQIYPRALSGPLPPGVLADFDGQPAALAQPDSASAHLFVTTAAPGWHRLTLRPGEQAALFAPRDFLIRPAR